MSALEPALHRAAFPADFIWGVATSAYQIEGAARADGKGESIWDVFCRQPGVIADGSHGDIACEHYQRLEADLDLIASLGVNTYRFSVSWPRVRPLGSGAWNEAGLAFYARMIAGLRARGIAPALTLNHWDLPQALQEEGGWANRATTDRFVEYALGIALRFGDQVESITTHNEPWVISVLGHEMGIFAPGIQNRRVAAQVSHHLLLSHGKALVALRAAGCPAKLGIVLNLAPVYPATQDAADVAKARLEDGRLVRWYTDALLRGAYPADVLRDLGADAPLVQPGDMELIHTPMDYLGVNYYSRSMVSAQAPWDVHSGGCTITDMQWEVYPAGLEDLLLRLHRDYTLPPIIITENGAAFADRLEAGAVHDRERIAYLQSHIAAVGRAMAKGAPVVGYMVWSLMDNFEWASGYAKRFGIVYVDYATQQRIRKDSALWYQAFLGPRTALTAPEKRTKTISQPVQHCA